MSEQLWWLISCPWNSGPSLADNLRTRNSRRVCPLVHWLHYLLWNPVFWGTELDKTNSQFQSVSPSFRDCDLWQNGKQGRKNRCHRRYRGSNQSLEWNHVWPSQAAMPELFEGVPKRSHDKECRDVTVCIWLLSPWPKCFFRTTIRAHKLSSTPNLTCKA